MNTYVKMFGKKSLRYQKLKIYTWLCFTQTHLIYRPHPRHLTISPITWNKADIQLHKTNTKFLEGEYYKNKKASDFISTRQTIRQHFSGVKIYKRNSRKKETMIAVINII